MRRLMRPSRPLLGVLLRGVLVAGAALALSGCGEPNLSSEQEQARDVSRAFLRAIVDEDADAACAQMAIQGRAVTDDPSWVEACVTGIEESNTSPERLDTYARQLATDPEVSEVKDDTVTVTWTADSDVTTHTVVEIDGSWLLTQ